MSARKPRSKVVLPGGCPQCEGDVVEAARYYSLAGEFFGNYLFWVCSWCGFELVPPDTARQIEGVAKAKGLFGSHATELPHAVSHLRAERAHA